MTHPYTLELAEEHIAKLRGKTDIMGERIETTTLIVDGTITATGGTSSAPTLINTDTWHTLGALGAHYTVTLGRYRLTTDNCVELDINVTGDGLQASAVTFANALPAAYRPATTHAPLPLGSTRAVNAADVWPRLGVDTAGNVTVTVQPINGISYGTCVRIPLD